MQIFYLKSLYTMCWTSLPCELSLLLCRCISPKLTDQYELIYATFIASKTSAKTHRQRKRDAETGRQCSPKTN